MIHHTLRRIILSWWKDIRNGISAANYYRFSKWCKKIRRIHRVRFVYWSRFRMRSHRVVIRFVEHVQGSKIRRVLFAVVKYENELNCFLLKDRCEPDGTCYSHSILWIDANLTERVIRIRFYGSMRTWKSFGRNATLFSASRCSSVNSVISQTRWKMVSATENQSSYKMIWAVDSLDMVNMFNRTNGFNF